MAEHLCRIYRYRWLVDLSLCPRGSSGGIRGLVKLGRDSGSRGYVSARCAHDDWRNVPFYEDAYLRREARGKRSRERRGRSTERRDEEEANLEERRRDEAVEARAVAVIIWCNAAIKGITRVDGYNFRGKWPRTLSPLFNTTRRWPSSFLLPLSLMRFP